MHSDGVLLRAPSKRFMQRVLACETASNISCTSIHWILNMEMLYKFQVMVEREMQQ